LVKGLVSVCRLVILSRLSSKVTTLARLSVIYLSWWLPVSRFALNLPNFLWHVLACSNDHTRVFLFSVNCHGCCFEVLQQQEQILSMLGLILWGLEDAWSPLFSLWLHSDFCWDKRNLNVCFCSKIILYRVVSSGHF
jgi:hypothetical protein